MDDAIGMPHYRILFVGNKEPFFKFCRQSLKQTGLFRVERTASAEGAIGRLSCRAYSCILSAHHIYDMNGMDLLHKIRTAGRDLPFILFTDEEAEVMQITASNHRADFYLRMKPDPQDMYCELLSLLVRVTEFRQVRDQLRIVHEMMRKSELRPDTPDDIRFLLVYSMPGGYLSRSIDGGPWFYSKKWQSPAPRITKKIVQLNRSHGQIVPLP